MKTGSIIWGAMALVSLVAVLTGATHHLMSLGVCAAMCLAFGIEDDKKDESDGQ